jgi:hypothetical protein
VTILLQSLKSGRGARYSFRMSAEKQPPTPLDVYYGLVSVLKTAGVRDPGGSVSCRRTTGNPPRYAVAAEPYVARRVQGALAKLLARPVSYTKKAGVVLSEEEAAMVAGCARVLPSPS